MSKIDLSEVTFVIPLLIDSQDRIENVEMAYSFLSDTFDTTILISEMFRDIPKITSIPVALTTQLTTPHFHKTKVLNQLYKMAKTPLVCRWDADILIRPEALVSARDEIISGEFEAIWPFDGSFYDFDRKFKDKFMSRDFDNLLLGTRLSEKYETKGTLISTASWGAAMMFLYSSFKSAGLENENLLGMGGSEDTETWHRLRQLSRKWGRSYNSPVYHLNHFRGFNSWEKNEYASTNARIANENGLRSKEDLEAEIATWTWNK